MSNLEAIDSLVNIHEILPPPPAPPGFVMDKGAFTARPSSESEPMPPPPPPPPGFDSDSDDDVPRSGGRYMPSVGAVWSVASKLPPITSSKPAPPPGSPPSTMRRAKAGSENGPKERRHDENDKSASESSSGRSSRHGSKRTTNRASARKSVGDVDVDDDDDDDDDDQSEHDHVESGGRRRGPVQDWIKEPEFRPDSMASAFTGEPSIRIVHNSRDSEAGTQSMRSAHPPPQRKSLSLREVAGRSRLSLKNKLSVILQKDPKLYNKEMENTAPSAVPAQKKSVREVMGPTAPDSEHKVKLMRNVISQLQVKLVERNDSQRTSLSVFRRRSADPSAAEDDEPAAEEGEKPGRRRRRRRKRNPACAICTKAVTPDQPCLIGGANEHFHFECAVCRHCGAPADETTYLVNGAVYCAESYRDYFIKTCAGCGKDADAKDLLLQVKDSTYHVDCFKCSTCDKVLVQVEDDGSAIRSLEDLDMDANGVLFCKDHGAKHTCAVCQEKIFSAEQALQAKLDPSQDKLDVFHSRCFKCNVCNNAIAEIGGGYVAHEGKIFCKADFAEALQLFCSSCNVAIPAGSEYVMLGDEKYHVDCFKCAKCGADRSANLVVAQSSGDLLCKNCRS